MKFVNIDIQNFMAVGKSSLSLNERGLILIQGENKDDTSQNSNGAGKCLPGWTMLQNCETGERITIEQLHRDFFSGFATKNDPVFRVLGLDEDLRLRPTRVVDAFKTGKKSIYRVTLSDGSHQDLSETHPLISEHGQKTVKELSAGDFIQAPRHLAVSSPLNEMPVSDAVLLSALMAEGCLTGKNYGFTNADSEIVDLVNRTLSHKGLELQPVKSREKLQYRLKSTLGEKRKAQATERCLKLLNIMGVKPHRFNAARIRAGVSVLSYDSLVELAATYGKKEFCDIATQLYPHEALRREYVNLGVHGKLAKEKSMPTSVFNLSDEGVKAFVAMFWACDGYVQKREHGGHEVSLCLASRQLVFDFQVLLKRLGISSAVKAKPSKDSQFRAWRLTPSGRESTGKLLEVLKDMPNRMKRERVESVLAEFELKAANENVDVIPARVLSAKCEDKKLSSQRLNPRRSRSQLKTINGTRKLAGDYAEINNDIELRNLAESDVFWRKIVQIEYLCEEETYDITVDNKTHLYALDNVITHNSSLVDALCWALYGQTAREETGDSVINRTAGKDCKVCVEVEDGGDTYLITRHRKFTKKKNVLEIVKNGKEDLTKGTDKLTQQVVDNVIGCSYDVFRSSVYAGQDAQIDLPKMTDKFLKAIVEEAAGIDRLQAAHEKAKEKRNDAAAFLDSQTKDLFQHEMTVDDSAFHMDEAVKRRDGYEEERQQEIEKYEFRIKNTREKAGALVKQIRGIDKDAIESEYEALINKGVDAAWKEKREELKQDIADIERGKADRSAELALLKRELTDAKIRIGESEALVGKDCNECGKPHTQDDIAGIVAQAKKVVAEKLPKAKALSAQINDSQSKLSEANAALSKHDDSMTVTDEEKAHRSALKAKLDEYQQLMQQARDKKKAIADDTAAIEQAKARPNPHEQTIKDVQARIDEAKRKIQECKDGAADAQKALDIANGVVEVYSNTGVRAHILDTVTPYLNARTAEYLGMLSDGNIEAVWNTLSTTTKGELREKFNIEVTSKTGGTKYGLLSGGEKRKVRLATNMALQDLVSSRATKPIDLYIGDEIDHALDVNGLERLMGLLEERAKVQGTVLVVSHNELSDWIRESITVVKENGYTTFTDSVPKAVAGAA